MDYKLTAKSCTFISVFNQLDAQNLFYNKFYFMSLHVSSTCAHYQEVKITLHSLWYHHSYRWPSRARDCLHLAVVGEGLAGLNDLTGYAGGNFVPGRASQAGQAGRERPD
jgi:hypothetical protein